MATIITRHVASTPHRTPGETWEVIAAILAPDKGSAARTELLKVGGVAAACISSESPNEDAFVVFGNGPQVRVYCVFGDDAISGDGVNEDSLREAPADNDWRLSMPCLPDDVDWTQKKLKSLSSRVTARATGEGIDYEKQKAAKASGAMVVNIEEYLKK